MSDFLDRLAARAIGSEPVLAPRLPTWFEPPARAPRVAFADDAAPAREARVDAPPARDAQQAFRNDPVRAPTAPRDPTVGVVATQHLEPAPMPKAMRTRDDAAPRTLPQVATDAAAQRSDEPTTPRSRTVALTPPPSRVRQTPPSAAPLRTILAPAAPTRGALQPPPTPVFAAPFGASTADRAGHITPRQRARDSIAHTLPAAEPVVHVTIGRLEVRAAPAPATPPRRSSGPRPTSLDDYLRQRSGRPPA